MRTHDTAIGALPDPASLPAWRLSGWVLGALSLLGAALVSRGWYVLCGNDWSKAGPPRLL